MLLTLVVNGQERVFGNLASPVTLADVVAAMNLKGDRVAVEHNGAIVQRAGWTDTPVASGDRLEVVHFVGGGRDVSSLWGGLTWRGASDGGGAVRMPRAHSAEGDPGEVKVSGFTGSDSDYT